MGRYRKLIAALIGVAAIVLGPEFLGMTTEEGLSSNVETVVEGIFGLLTALGVWGAKNDL